jgi:hypothetical protein
MSSRSRRSTVFGGSFIGHTLEMRRSPAWRALPDTARRVLDRLEVEHMEHAGTANGQLICTYDQFARAGIRRASVALALRQLAALGFIRVTEQGGRAIAELRQPSRYWLTYPPVLSQLGSRPDQTGPTNDWRFITTEEEAAAALEKAAAWRNHKTQPTPRKNKIPDALARPVPDAPLRLAKANCRTR